MVVGSLCRGAKPHSARPVNSDTRFGFQQKRILDTPRLDSIQSLGKAFKDTLLHFPSSIISYP
jgi:hypothetical protein